MLGIVLKYSFFFENILEKKGKSLIWKEGRKIRYNLYFSVMMFVWKIVSHRDEKSRKLVRRFFFLSFLLIQVKRQKCLFLVHFFRASSSSALSLLSRRNPDSCTTFTHKKLKSSGIAVSREKTATKQLKIKCLAYLAQCNLYCFSFISSFVFVEKFSR